MNGTVEIIGGIPLRGEVAPIPNKNSILAALPAAILTNEDVIFKNIPNTTDVGKILGILKKMGAEVDTSISSRVVINCKNLNTYRVDPELGGQFRGSLMFIGPLLARFSKAEVPMPGGCVLGMRSIEAHTNIFSKVGVKLEREGQMLCFEAPKNGVQNSLIWQIEASVSATENFALYAAGVEQEFELIDAACEPHVTDLLVFLQLMGVRVEGIGSNHLKIKGSKKLSRATFIPTPDFVDMSGYIAAAAITNGEIRIKGGNIPDIVQGIINWFEMFNVSIKKEGNDLIAKRAGELEVDVFKSGFPLAAPDLPKLAPRPWPGFPVDVLPVMVALAIKSKGRLLLQNWMYEAGFSYIQQLNDLGAEIFIVDPQRIIVSGPRTLTGGEVVSPAIIQGCKALFLAALMDPVKTRLHGVDILKRRYPDILNIYRSLGAKIQEV